MRIGFDASKALVPRDGIARFSRCLLDALLDLDGDHEVVLSYAPDDARAPEHPRLRSVPGPPRSDEIDLFHSMTWEFPELQRTPCVFTCHDLTVLTHPELHTVDNALHCMTGVLSAHLGDAHFHSVSGATAVRLRERLDVPAERITVIPLAAEERCRPPDAEAAARLRSERFDLDGSYILSVGTFEPRKNLRRLIAAWRVLDDETRREFPLVLVGASGWLENDRDLDDVRRLGFVNEDELVALYGGAAVFAYPSLAEGFGLPVLEAMACGAPVLASTDAALTETAGGAAKHADPLDVEALGVALEELLGDAEERARLRDLGLRRAQEFSWRRTAEQMLALYREVAA